MSKHHRKPTVPAPASPPLRISVITPSFNTGAALEAAILSVLAQDYPHFEHWIIDGGSTDGTLDILRRYPHLKWVSEPDRGQSDAMNKGFALSTGDLVVYLNADDLLAEGAFSAVMPHFQKGAQVVMGRVRVVQENNDSDWINDPKSDFASMLRHWELNAFCVNPVGYYYRREVQQAVPFNLANDDKMDLEFLLGVASRFAIVKVDRELGTFNYAARCKTGREQARLDYWRPDNFSFLDPYVDAMPPPERAAFRRRQLTGYQAKRLWTIEALKRDLPAFDAAFQSGALMPLPADERQVDASGVADTAHWLADGDAVVVLLACGDAAPARAAAYLRGLPQADAPFPVYLLPGIADDVVTQALRAAFAQYGERLRWIFLAVRGAGDAPSLQVGDFLHAFFGLPGLSAARLLLLLDAACSDRQLHAALADGLGLGDGACPS